MFSFSVSAAPSDDNSAKVEKATGKNPSVSGVISLYAGKERLNKVTVQLKKDSNTSKADSNVLTFSVVEDGFVASSRPDLDTYYARNLDFNGKMKAVVVIVHGLAEHLGRYNERPEMDEVIEDVTNWMNARYKG